MPTEKRSPVSQQIRQIIIVLGLGVLSAVLFAVATLYYFGPSGSFRVSGILLSPEMAKELSYTDINPQTRKPAQFALDRIEFLYLDDETNAWIRRNIDLQNYGNFYEMIQADSSLSVVPENVSSLFGRGDQAVLYLLVKRVGPSDASEEKRSFQELQFQGHGDYYRIQIHDEDEGRNWAYFYHEGIYQDALNALLNKS